MKRIVVTGALGHIGSRFIRELPAAFPAADIVLVDNLATRRYTSLFNLPSQATYHFVEADVLEADLAALFAGADVVVHLAAVTGDAGTWELPEEMERANVTGTARVAHACVASKSAMIFVSTTSVYGTTAAVIDEECPVEDLRPQSPYAASKLRAERQLIDLGSSDGLRFAICRFGTIFGTSPGMRFDTAVNKFVWQACMGLPLTVWRTALHQRRPYLDLDDAVRALTFIISRGLYDRQIYNVLTTNTTVSEIVECLRQQTPDVAIGIVDAEIMNEQSFDVSREKFAALGFEFTGSLPRGIASTVALLRCGHTSTVPTR